MSEVPSPSRHVFLATPRSRAGASGGGGRNEARRARLSLQSSCTRLVVPRPQRLPSPLAVWYDKGGRGGDASSKQLPRALTRGAIRTTSVLIAVAPVSAPIMQVSSKELAQVDGNSSTD